MTQPASSPEETPGGTAWSRPPSQGEVWLVNLDPTVGRETKKTRPAVVVSADNFGWSDCRIIVPVTEWNASYEDRPWLVRLDPTATNGLAKASAADGFQVRCVSIAVPRRFVECQGRLAPDELESVLAAVAVCLDIEVV